MENAERLITFAEKATNLPPTNYVQAGRLHQSPTPRFRRNGHVVISVGKKLPAAFRLAAVGSKQVRNFHQKTQNIAKGMNQIIQNKS